VRWALYSIGALKREREREGEAHYSIGALRRDREREREAHYSIGALRRERERERSSLLDRCSQKSIIAMLCSMFEEHDVCEHFSQKSACYTIQGGQDP